MDKIDRDGENKTQRIYRCCSNYALSKLIVDTGLEDLWRRKNPDFLEFICYDRSFAKDQYRYMGSMEKGNLGSPFFIDPVYTDIKNCQKYQD